MKLAALSLYYFAYTLYEQTFPWCFGGTFHIADFNGDGTDDLMCHVTDGGISHVTYGRSPYGYKEVPDYTDYTKSDWCSHEGSAIFTGDFNGDSRDDILCHDVTGDRWIALADEKGEFGDTFWASTERIWCVNEQQLFIGDFNGDGRDDMLCHQPHSDGYKWTSLAKPDGTFEVGDTWYSKMNWCIKDHQILKLGDFNGDGRADMLCTDRKDGHIWIALADEAGTFPGNTWDLTMRWCFGYLTMSIGDFNGDGRDDLVCHRLSDGYKWISLANIDGSFHETSWEKAMGWCYHEGAEFHVGDFDGDQQSDFLCKDSCRLGLALGE